MADWPVAPDGQLYEKYSASTAAITGASVDPGATIHNKGAWVSIIDNATHGYNGFLLQVFNNVAAGVWAIDLAYAASPTAIFVADILISSARAGQLGTTIYIPMPVPSGGNVHARCQSTVASNTIQISAIGIGHGGDAPPSYTRCQTIGANVVTNTSTRGSQPTQVQIPNTPAWLQIGTTVEPIKAISALFSSVILSTPTGGIFWELGIGAGPTPISGQLIQSYSTAGDQPNPTNIGPLPLHIPAATAVHVRCLLRAGAFWAQPPEISILGFS